MTSIVSRIAADCVLLGRSMTLKRRTGTSDTFTSVTLYGIPKAYKPGEVLGDIKQGDQQVTISNAEIAAAAWPGPPKKGDILVIDSRSWTVQGVETKYLGAVIAASVLHVRGG